MTNEVEMKDDPIIVGPYTAEAALIGSYVLPPSEDGHNIRTYQSWLIFGYPRFIQIQKETKKTAKFAALK